MVIVAFAGAVFPLPIATGFFEQQLNESVAGR
jgi:hypothetical protein